MDIEKKELMFRLIVGLLLVINITVTLKLLATTLHHYERLTDDPLMYGAEKYNLDQCSCTTNKAQLISFNQTSIIQTRTLSPSPRQSPVDIFISNLSNAS